MLAALRMFEHKLTGWREGRTFLLDTREVLYIDTVDKKTFLYQDKEVYETPLRLYELEERLSGSDFIRISKSAIVNLARVSSLRPEFGGRLELSLENGERVLVSRQYAPALREKIGIA
ncbi:LytTR family transcriptional regulator DNA-binding domain-containing protein [Oscillospiraceae bacterium NSJ-54]|uniref:LytTR family transcriptional regulator DNA-binding domain-containing protein n=2 Tax=Zongyangia hominis TaxID=2763677 RepID=A0A926EFC7_9FIRM|nr:LytTR family transcriptional regulator DNA-binding domain-containing protein [Zongyangia hominis]